MAEELPGDDEARRVDSTLEVRRSATRTLAFEDTYTPDDPPPEASPLRDDFPLVEGDPYDRGDEVARGGLGRIVQGYDRRLGRRVALKELISRDPKAERRFVREAKITARLEHPNIVPIHEAGRWPDGDRFYAMKLVEGRTLSAALAEADTREKRLGLVPHLIDVADAVAYAHSQGILHRDLKPANVMVGPFGETLVIDWGLAKDLTEDEDDPPLPPPGAQPIARASLETSDGIVVGTPPYMPPEQARADLLDERSDVYALGALLYQILSGRRPYEDVHPKEVLLAVVNGPPAPIERLAPDMPRDLVAIVKKAMHRNPSARYPTAQEMAEELRRFTTGQLVGAHRYSPFERALRFVRRNAATVVVALFLLTVLLGFAGWSFQLLARRSEDALDAQLKAEVKVQELTLEKARSLLARDPTEAAAWLKKVRPPLEGTASLAAEAAAAGVAKDVLRGHVQEVDLVRADPQGRLVASASRDGAVRLWSLATGVGQTIDHGARVSALSFSPDGDHLASGAYDGSVRITTLGARGTIERVLVAEGHGAPVVALRFAPTGDRLVSLGRDRRLVLWTLDGDRAESIETPPVGDWADLFFLDEDRTVVSGGHGSRAMLWDLDRAEGSVLVDVLRADITALAVRAGVVAIGAGDGTVAVVDPNRAIVRTVGGHQSEVRALAFSPEGWALASASLGGEVSIWYPAGAQPSQTFADHDERVTAIGFSPSGRWLASASWDGTVRLRDLGGAETRTFRGHGQVVTDLAFDPRGTTLASSSWDSTVRLWPVAGTGARRLEGHRIGVHAVDFSPDGRRLVSGGHDDELRLWDLRTGRARVLAGHDDNVFRVLFSPDGQWIASSSDDRDVRLWSSRSDEVRVLRGHEADVEELRFSPDGAWLASAGRDGGLWLWPTEEGPGRRLAGHGGAVTGVGFVAGGRLLSAGRDGQVKLWPPGPGSPQRLLVDAGPLEGLDVTSDGARGAVVGGGGELWVWAFPEARLIRHLADLPEASMVRLSPDGALAAVASAQSGLWLCNLAYGLCDALEGHEARVFDLEFSPSGRALVTGSGDHSVRVWDVETLESRVLRGHRAPVFDVAFSPDGSFVASGSGDTDVRVWPTVLPPRPDDVGSYLDGLTRYRVE